MCMLSFLHCYEGGISLEPVLHERIKLSEVDRGVFCFYFKSCVKCWVKIQDRGKLHLKDIHALCRNEINGMDMKNSYLHSND